MKRKMKRSSLAFTISGEWSAFCAISSRTARVGADPRFQSNKLRVENRAAMDSAIVDVFRNLHCGRSDRAAGSRRIANARINSVTQFIKHPQFTARNSWREVDSPAGPIPALIPPVRMSGVDPIMGAIPGLGTAFGIDPRRVGI